MLLERFLFLPFLSSRSERQKPPLTGARVEDILLQQSVTDEAEATQTNVVSQNGYTEPLNGDGNVQISECSRHDLMDLSRLESRRSQQPESNNNSLAKSTGHQLSSPFSSRTSVSVLMADDTIAPASTLEDETEAIVLNPDDSERQYYHDPYTGLQREVWRPGDGDGDKSVDYYEWSGPPPPLEKRWKLYQSRTGAGPIKRGVNEPPKYVILDDRAAYEVLASDIHRKSLVRFWQHDFGGIGVVRARRPHRGRAAIADPDAPGDEKFHFGNYGIKKERYYFTGEQDYTPIIYRSAESAVAREVAEEPQKRKAASAAQDIVDPKRRLLRHNQHTKKSMLVKNGAPGHGQRKRGKHQLIPALRWYDAPSYLPAHPDLQAKLHAQQSPHNLARYGDEVKSVLENEQDVQLMYQSTPVPADAKNGSSSDMEEFPFARRHTSASLSTTSRRRSAGNVEHEPADQHDFYSADFAGGRVVDSIEHDSGYSPVLSRFERSPSESQLESELENAARTTKDQNKELQRAQHAQQDGARNRSNRMDAGSDDELC